MFRRSGFLRSRLAHQLLDFLQVRERLGVGTEQTNAGQDGGMLLGWSNLEVLDDRRERHGERLGELGHQNAKAAPPQPDRDPGGKIAAAADEEDRSHEGRFPPSAIRYRLSA